MVFYHPGNNHPGKFGEAIKELRRRNPKYLERNVGNVVLEWVPVLIERAYQINKRAYLIILFNKRPFSIGKDLPERVLKRGHDWGHLGKVSCVYVAVSKPSSLTGSSPGAI